MALRPILSLSSLLPLVPVFGKRPNVEREIEIETMKRNTEQLILILILQCGKQFFSTEK